MSEGIAFGRLRMKSGAAQLSCSGIVGSATGSGVMRQNKRECRLREEGIHALIGWKFGAARLAARTEL
jgi:hypothetical protein